MSAKLHKDPVAITHAKKVLQGITSSCRSLKFATILTDDGFEVAQLASDGTGQPRIASMASSMQALGDAITRDLKIGSNDYIIVAAKDGYVIQLRVPALPLVIAAYFHAGETVGKALSVARIAATEMGTLQQSQAA